MWDCSTLQPCSMFFLILSQQVLSVLIATQLGSEGKLVLSALADLERWFFRFANSVSIAEVVTSVWMDLIITVGYFLHRN